MKKNKNGAFFNIKEMQDYLNLFIKQRNWDKYRTPKNLCMALAVEVSELLEIFQWEKNHSAKIIKKKKKIIMKANEEIADILSYLLQLASVLDIDLNKVFWEKMKKNEEKHTKHIKERNE